MTIDKAIELLSLSANARVTTFGPDFKDAEKLGIESLKETRRLRKYKAWFLKKSLPGETKEGG